MNRRFPVPFLMVLALSTNAVAQQTIVAASRSIDWSKAGVTGGIPSRTTVCATLSPGTSAAAINSALSSCPSGQVVILNAGTYNLSAGITFNATNNVTLRGAGPDQTFLVFTGTTSCGGKTAAICVPNGYLATPSNIDDNGPNYASWTAGYARGTTSITIGTVSGIGTKPTVGTNLVLDQLGDTSDPSDGLFVCSITPGCVQSGSTGAHHDQQQLVTVTSISSGTCPCTVGISPGLYMPNWQSGHSPRAWWTGNQASATLPITGVGIENMSIDISALGTNFAYGISFFWATNSWVKGIRLVRSGAEPVPNNSQKMVLFFISSHITVRDSYFFGRTGYDDYVIDFWWTSDNLIENNIIQRIPIPVHNEKGQGNVIAYNYMIRSLWGPDNTWAQGSSAYHQTGSSFDLHEGNIGHGLELENYFGQAHFITAFRNRFTGWETPQVNQTVPVFIYALSRYENIIGNVLGTSSYHTTYQTVAGGSTTNCNSSVYAIGLGGNCSNGGGSYPANDTLATTTLFRWGNWDVITNAARWCGNLGNTGWSTNCASTSEVPTASTSFAQPVPSTETLPASFYLAVKPTWWGTMPWPAIGPDVTGGDVSNVGGHAYRNPAQKCFEDVMGGTFGDTTARTFRPAVCYPSATRPSTPWNLHVN